MDHTKVFFSSVIKQHTCYSKAFTRIKFLLDKHKIEYAYLDNTKDIWARDYMPIQVSKDKFVQFRYEPSYLTNDLNLQSNSSDVLLATGIQAMNSEINLDGGNIICSDSHAILTERVFYENPELDEDEIQTELTSLLNRQVYFIKDDPEDLTGHIDGYLRLINDDTILVNEIKYESLEWQKSFYKMIKNSGLNYIEIPWFTHFDKKYPLSSLGCYVNYLEIDNLIIFPIFEIEGNKDREAIKVIQSVFPDKIIETININEIGFHGGLMNCISWTLKINDGTI